MDKKFTVLKDFDYVTPKGAIMTFTKGQVRTNLTRACIERGKSLNALKPITKKDSKDG